MSTNSSASCSETFGPRSLISVCSPGRRVDHRGVRARLLADAHEVAEHRELRELVDDPRAGRAAGQAGRDHRGAERLQHARDVHALAAWHRGLLHGAVAAPEPEVRDGQGLVDGRVESDRDDHAARASSRARRWPVRESRAVAVPEHRSAQHREREHDTDRRREPGLGALRQTGRRHLRVADQRHGGDPFAVLEHLRHAEPVPYGIGPWTRVGYLIGRTSRRRADRAGPRCARRWARPRARAPRRGGSGSAPSRRPGVLTGAAVIRWKPDAEAQQRHRVGVARRLAPARRAPPRRPGSRACGPIRRARAAACAYARS